MVARRTANSDRLADHGHCMRILAGGQILDHRDMYDRAHEMLGMFSATDSREKDYGEGFASQIFGKAQWIQIL